MPPARRSVAPVPVPRPGSPPPPVCCVAAPRSSPPSSPEIIGFPPTESVVVLCFGGGARRPKELVFTVRVDLPEVRHDLDVVAEGVLRHVDRIQPPPQRAMFFVVTDGPTTRSRASPRSVGGRAAPHRCRRAPHGVPTCRAGPWCTRSWRASPRRAWPTQDAVLVRDGRWWSYPDVDPHTGAGPGTELDPTGSRLSGIAALTVVWCGPTGLPSRAGPADAPPTIAQLGACQRASANCSPVSTTRTRPWSWPTCRPRSRPHCGRTNPGAGSRLTPDALARVAVGLLLVPVRDHALALSCRTGGTPVSSHRPRPRTSGPSW